MKNLVLTPDKEKSTYGERYCVTVDFADPRIEGTITIGSMATPDYVRYQGAVKINGVDYRVSNNCAVSVPKVESYALTKNGTFADYGTPAAREVFRKALEEIVAEVLKDEDFVNEQLQTESQYLEYDIDRLKSERDSLRIKINEIDEEISRKLSKQLANKVLIG